MRRSELESGAIGPGWFLETVHSSRGVVRRAIETYLRALRPHRFWNAFGMNVQFRPGRACIFLLAVLISVHLALGSVRMYEFSKPGRFRTLPTWNGAPLSISQGPSPREIIADATFAFLLPLHSIPGSDMLNLAQSHSRAGPLQPLTLVHLYEEVTGSYGSEITFGREGALRRTCVAFVAIPPLAVASLALLPWTLQTARVRPRHLVRGAIYSCAHLPLVLTLVLLSTLNPRSSTLIVAAFATSLFCSVSCVDAIARCYLRLRHPLATAILLSLVGSLTSMTVLACVWY